MRLRTPSGVMTGTSGKTLRTFCSKLNITTELLVKVVIEQIGTNFGVFYMFSFRCDECDLVLRLGESFKCL